MTFKNEQEFTKAVLKAIQSVPGVFAWRASVGARGNKKFGVPGQPDIMAVVCGMFVGIELKMPGKQLRPDQEAWAENVLKAHGAYVRAETVDEALAPVIAVLDANR